MCGIAGWLGFLPDNETYAGRLAEALYHRGPDGCGIRHWPAATLVHTRLSIIDLSAAGAQPMSNEDGTIWTIFNGEIYNHRELRGDLEARGHLFKGHSDTEVLPHLYEEFGSDFIPRLRGMYALAIYDARRRVLLLARDRFGIKPLFYAPRKNRLAFASEIRALLELPEIDMRPDRQAVFDFAALCYIPAPQTFYAGIRALEPGQLLEGQFDGQEVSFKLRRYHHWTISINPTITMSEAVDRAEELVGTAVCRQMESDVPLGALLSGGIDSSLLSVAAQRSRNERLRTFNVRFADETYDETWAAVAVAKHIGSQHQTLDMDESSGTWDHICNLLQHAGQPFADTSIFAVNAVCQLMRRHVTVALSGDGGDEGFGYDIYSRVARVARWQRFPAPVWRLASRMLVSLASFVPEHLPHRVLDLGGADNTSIIRHIWSWVGETQHANLCQDSHNLPVRRWFEPQWNYDLPGNASRFDQLFAQATEIVVRMTLANDFLFKVDTASMKEGLEVRVPMLDEELFAFALSLPHHLKVKSDSCKRVLRALAERQLPQEIAHKPKCGFGVPVDAWVNTDFKVRLRDTLLSSSSGLPEFFRPETYRPILEAFCDGRPCPGIPRDLLYQLAIMFLAVHLGLQFRPSPQPNRSRANYRIDPRIYPS